MISSATTTAPLPLTTHAADLAGASPRGATRAGGASRSLVELAIQAAAPELIKLAASVARSTARTATRKSTSSGAGYASSTATAKNKATTSTSAKQSASSAAKKELAFLSDPKLTIEDKLMRLMAVLTSRYEADMQQHMDRLAGGGAAKSTTKSGTPKSGGTAGGSSKKSGGVLAAVKKFLPVVGMTIDALQSRSVQAALKAISGPVLAAGATAMGFPMLAPVLLKVGPQILGAVGDLANAVDAAGSSDTGARRSAVSSSSASSFATTSDAASASSGTSSKSSASSGASNLSDSERQLELMQIQRLQDRQKEMFGLVSNLLRGTHDTRAAIIANMRS